MRLLLIFFSIKNVDFLLWRPHSRIIKQRISLLFNIGEPCAGRLACTVRGEWKNLIFGKVTIPITAGIFLIIRCSPLLEYTETVLMFITWIGALTVFFAATVGMLQNDLKRVIAYSTCSQLGYMAFSCGLSNYAVAFFHLINHGFGRDSSLICPVMWSSFYLLVVQHIASSCISLRNNLTTLKEKFFRSWEKSNLRWPALRWWILKIGRTPFLKNGIVYLSLFPIWKDRRSKVGRNWKFYAQTTGIKPKILSVSGNLGWPIRGTFISNYIFFGIGKTLWGGCLITWKYDWALIQSGRSLSLRFLTSPGPDFNIGEVRRSARRLNKEIVILFGQNKWPFSEGISVSSLILDLQTLIAQCSTRDKDQVQHIQEEFITSLFVRVAAVQNLILSFGGNDLGVGSLISLKKNEEKILLVSSLKRNTLISYKSFSFKYAAASIQDILVQFLFKIIIQPQLEAMGDLNSFGFRKGRTAHMAVSVVDQFLNCTCDSMTAPVTNIKYALNFSMSGFFGNVTHNWVMKNFPFPVKWRFILSQWLKAGIIKPYFTREWNSKPEKLQYYIIGPLIINFVLDGLQSAISSYQWKKVQKKTSIGCFKPTNSSINFIEQTPAAITAIQFVRYADAVIIILSNHRYIEGIKRIICIFLEARGLRLSKVNYKLVKIVQRAKFTFLNFTFIYLENRKSMRFLANTAPPGVSFSKCSLFIIPSCEAVGELKHQIREIFSRINFSSYQIIVILNSLLSGWCQYFCLGHPFWIFNYIDYYIYTRSLLYLKRKFSKMPLIKLFQANYWIISAKTGAHLRSSDGKKCHFHGSRGGTLGRPLNMLWVIMLSCYLTRIPAYLVFTSIAFRKSNYFLNPQLYVGWAARFQRRRLLRALTRKFYLSNLRSCV